MNSLSPHEFMSLLTFGVGFPLLVSAVLIAGVGRRGYLKFLLFNLALVVVIILAIKYMPWLWIKLIAVLTNLVGGINTFIGKVKYNEGAILTMAQIEGVLASIAIPLGLNMVSKVADRYKSSAVTTYFKNKKQIKYFPWFMLGLMSATLLPLGFKSPSVEWPFFTIIAALLFTGAVIMAGLFLNLLRSYTGSDYILDDLSKDIDELIQ